MTERPDPQEALRGLKDFQLRTVEAAFNRLWGTADPTTRFLVADEVGLGKTLVAKGVLARTVDHLWDSDPRIDIVYICSNSQIARQNLRRLHEGLHAQIPHADRLTMLPTVLHQMGRQKVNIISFTPGTSFSLGNRGGQAQERALLFVILQELWGRRALRSAKWVRFFQGGASEWRIRREISQVDRTALDRDLVEAFGEALREPQRDGRPLEDALRQSADEFAYLRKGKRVRRSVSRRRFELIGKMRQALAKTCIGYLHPDLVILDEFQRFSQLLSGTDDASLLVQDLLGPVEVERSGEERKARTLLLSATPFKMYTLPDEPEGDDHYRDFMKTVTFLAGPERARVVQDGLSEMRAGLIRGEREEAVAAKDVAERELRRVMARTERLADSEDRNGMLTAHTTLVQVTTADVQDYLQQAAVSRALGAPDGLEYWRSSPYVFELMEKYHVKRKLENDIEAGTGALAGLLRSRITPQDIDAFRQVDLGNPRVRWLADDVLSTGAWQAAWLAPSLPYYSPAGVYANPAFQRFTKRLIFSAWSVVPKAIATSISYEVERLLAEQSSTMQERGYFATRRGGLLTFTVADGRPVGMPALALLYPCVSLARVGDPLQVAARLGEALPLDRNRLVSTVREAVEGLLRGIPTGNEQGSVDQRWYWAAPLLLDRHQGLSTLQALSFRGESGAGFRRHVEEGLNVTPDALGARPSDLADVLTDLAIAGPGVCSLRALARSVGGMGELESADVRAAASDWAWSLRALFNNPEIIGALEVQGEGSYWQHAMHHAMDGNLQSVLDEYAQVLMGAHSLAREERAEQLSRLSAAFGEGSGLLASPQAMDFFLDGVQPADRRRIRTHFAARYGRAAAIDEQTVQRESQVREAFNSPFWPFILASTSVGQEGLDFHHYSHAVVHWNLPSNPVDLEQREGRVHRFRGHAVRKNVAAAHASNSSVVGGHSPWPVLFQLAGDERGARSQIYPDWVYPGDATIERYVPLLPMSRGTQHYRRLIRTLGAYRLVLGQPRQADLIAYVGAGANLSLDLSP